MNYSYEKAEKSTVRIKITLDENEWKDALKKAYETTKGKYSLQGFRKGHVPMSVIEGVYGKGVFFEDAINEAFPEHYYAILDKEPDILPIDRPELDIGRLDETGVEMIAVVPVRPDVKIGAYTGIKIDKVEYNVKDEDVDFEVKKLLDRNSRLVEVAGRAAADGDVVNINYSGSVDGVKFEGGTADDQTLQLGSKSFITGFEEQVAGMNIGDEKDINVTFPEDYHAEELKGKAAVFHVKLNAIKTKETPELTDDFIKDAVGADSIEAYKADQRERLQKDADRRTEAEIEDKLIKAISDKTEVEIPQILIDKQIDSMVRDVEYRLSYQGLKLADYLKYIGKTEQDMRSEYAEQAAVSVKSQLVIDEIIKTEKIEATDAEFDAKIAEGAAEAKKTVEEYTEKMDPRQKDYIRDGIVIEKLFAFLKQNNQIG